MADCAHIERCAFFKNLMDDHSSLAGLFRQRYCRGHANECARVQVEKAGAAVPDDLFPNQSSKAAELIASLLSKTA